MSNKRLVVGAMKKTIPLLLMSWVWIACEDGDSKPVMPTSDSGVELSDMMNDSEAIRDGFVDEMGTVWLPPPETPERPACDDDHVPIVMAHGFLGAGDTWSPHRRRFIANGVCADRIYAFDWNSLDQTADHPALLGAFIETVLAAHGVAQVDLIGHSAGGRLGYDYLSVAARRQTVRRYVHVGSFPNERLPGPETEEERVPTLNLWSEADLVVEGGDIPGATNVRLPDADHYAVATSDEAFIAVYEFLNDAQPATTALPEQDPAIVNGRFLTFGENQPVEGGEIEVWVVSEENGTRLRPAQRFEVSADGHFGPLIASKDERYEFVGRGGDPNGVAVRHFFEPFVGDKSLAYVRGFPGPGSIAGALVVLLPRTETQATLVVYNARGSFLAGRDSLTLNGQELLNEETASAENTSIALFIFDIDGDNATGGRSPLFDMFPFLAAIDQPLPVSETQAIELNFNGRKLVLPSEPATDGIFVAIFD